VPHPRPRQQEEDFRHGAWLSYFHYLASALKYTGRQEPKLLPGSHSLAHTITPGSGGVRGEEVEEVDSPLLFPKARATRYAHARCRRRTTCASKRRTLCC
jgi:hypothetical protein